MLSNRGSVKSGLMFLILIAVVICIIFLFIAIKGRFNLFSKTNEYEAELIRATNKYIDEYYPSLGDGENLIIKLPTLRSLNYVNLENCEGYSIVTKEGKLEIEAYVNCNDYKSPNYDESKL